MFATQSKIAYKMFRSITNTKVASQPRVPTNNLYINLNRRENESQIHKNAQIAKGENLSTTMKVMPKTSEYHAFANLV